MLIALTKRSQIGIACTNNCFYYRYRFSCLSLCLWLIFLRDFRITYHCPNVLTIYTPLTLCLGYCAQHGQTTKTHGLLKQLFKLLFFKLLFAFWNYFMLRISAHNFCIAHYSPRVHNCSFYIFTVVYNALLQYCFDFCYRFISRFSAQYFEHHLSQVSNVVAIAHSVGLFSILWIHFTSTWQLFFIEIALLVR